MVKLETRCRNPIWRTFWPIPWHATPEPPATLQGAATCHIAECCHLANSMSWSQSCVSHCRVLPSENLTAYHPRATYHIPGCAATWWIHCHYSRATLQSAVTWRNQCHDRATLQGVIIPSAILKIVFRHILFYFLFYLLQFGLWRAAAFVWSPIHLLQVIQLFALSTRKYGGFLAYELTAKIESFLRKAVQWGFSSHYKCLTDLLREADLHLFRKIWHQTVGMIASISYFLPQKFCPWSLETLTVYLPYRLTPVPSVIITCTNILLFLGICFFSAYWMHVRWHCIFSYFLVLIYLLMLCLQLAEGVWSSFIKRITYLLTYLPLLI